MILCVMISHSHKSEQALLARILHEGFDVGSVVEMVGGGASWGRRG
jgi:hypothetical protein